MNLAADWKVLFGLHNFDISLATALLKQKVDPKTVRDPLHHEDFTKSAVRIVDETPTLSPEELRGLEVMSRKWASALPL